MYLYLRTYIIRYVYVYIYTCICRQQDQHLCMHTFTAFTFWPLTHIGTWRVGSWCSMFVESWLFGYNWFSQITLSVGSQSFDPPTEPKLWLTKQTWPSCIVIQKAAQMHGFAADLYAFGVLLVMMLTGGEAMWTSFLLGLWRWVHWAVLCFYPRVLEQCKKTTCLVSSLFLSVCTFAQVRTFAISNLSCESFVGRVGLVRCTMTQGRLPLNGGRWNRSKGKLGSCSWRFLYTT